MNSDNKSLEIDTVDWLGAGAAIASITAVGVALGLGLPLLSVILEQRGFSSTVIGFNTAVAGLASILATPLTTPIARRLGVRLTMLICILAAAISALGFYYFTSLLAWTLLRLVFHFSVTTMFVLSEFWINMAAPPKRRGLILGIYATSLALGFAAGPFVFSQVGSQGITPFAIGASVLLASAVPLIAAWNREPPLTKTHKGSGFRRHLFSVPAATGAVLVFGAVEAGGFALFPIFGSRLGMDEASAAQLLTAVGLGSVALQIPIGLISDRVRDRRSLLLLFAGIGLAGSLVLPLISGSWWAMAVVLFGWGGVVAGLYTVGLAHLGSRLSGHDLASANAAFIFCYSMGMLIGPQLIGGSMDVFGTSGFAWSLASMFAAYFIFMAFRLARIRRRP
ncbi:MFS transporter [Aureimonas fodinaquatilis]|uniref:MFS transporter n=1 Tax=Aureimonas fodinaquatilis TaxID=2565783 RepID=A0A5B0DX36_9HYPH|nr:MFS transporter [Aureimonas fodinaquatilis]KAA0970130.1 MFS transporter [Aureimonas fodinaquatilis]